MDEHEPQPPALPPPPPRPTYLIATGLFLRLLGALFLVAALSIWTQVHGLVGEQGIMPVREFLDLAFDRYGHGAYHRFPTYCWIASGDLSLDVQCGVVTFAAVLLILGLVPGPALLVLWSSYLSLVIAGQRFLSFQWDTLLLETALMAMFIAPWRLRMRRTDPPPPAAGLWLLRALLFKLMFLSGVTKLLSGDPTWRDFTALDHHYQTQPLPTWIGWHVHHLPDWLHKTSIMGMYVVEIIIPVLIFMPARWRRLGGLAMIAFQFAIVATGNYGYFNLLTIALCVLLLDDRFLRRLTPSRWTAWVDRERRPPWKWRQLTTWLLASALLVPSTLVFLREMTGTVRDPSTLPAPFRVVIQGIDGGVVKPLRPVIDTVRLTRTINGYGLFRVMTTRRNEILIQGSADGLTWRDYELPWKPGDPTRRPGFVAPHMPRLDWQLWFASLSPRTNERWLSRMMVRVVEHEPAVLDLFEVVPFDDPPRYLRLGFYEYEFTDPETRARTGEWWKRRRLQMFMRPIRRLDPVEERPDAAAW